MTKRTLDRLAALEALLLASPNVDGPARFFTVPVSIASATDWHVEVERAKADAIAQGIVLAPDAMPSLAPFKDHAEAELWLMAQQAHLIASADMGFERIEARNAERKAADDVGKQPQRKPQPSKPPPQFTDHTNAFAPVL